MSTLSALLVVTEEVFNIWFDYLIFKKKKFQEILCKICNLVLGRGGYNIVVAISFCLVWCYCKSNQTKEMMLFPKSPVFKGNSGEWVVKWMEVWIPAPLSVFELWGRHDGSIVLQLVKLLVGTVKCLHSCKCHCCYVWIIHMLLPDLWQWL